MPFAFPSHQGLVAPLWRKWPHAFDMPAVCVGAVMPDVVDGINGAIRGYLGQGIGHSLIGMVPCMVGGIALWFALHPVVRRLPFWPGEGFWARSWNMGIEAIRGSIQPESFRAARLLITWSLFVGAVGHVFVDFISHGEFALLYPYYLDARIFPDFWYWTWFYFPLPGYKDPYPIGVHFGVWCAFNVIGAYLLFKPAIRRG